MNVAMENTSSCISTKYATEYFEFTNQLHIFRLIAYGVLFLFGVPGNCLIFRVYWTKTLMTSTHFFIKALAAADLMVCLMLICNVLVIIVTNNYQAPIPHVLEFIMTLKEVVIFTSVLITAVIAADRYDCICRHPKRFFTLKRAKITLVVSLLVSVITTIPSFINVQLPIQLLSQAVCFEIALLMITVCYTKVYTTIKKHVRVGKAPSMLIEINNRTSHRNPEFNLANEPCSGSSKSTHACTSHVPISSISLKAQPRKESGRDSTVRFMREGSPIREQQGDKKTQPDGVIKRKSSANLRSPDLQRKTTRMLFITRVVFLLTWLPYWIGILLTSLLYFGVCLRIDPYFYTLLRSMHVLFYVNNAVNPLIYGLANRRFRKDCKEVFRKMSFC